MHALPTAIGDTTLEAVRGPAIADVLADVARLRIAVFAEYPYLYDGDLTYEQGYLASYAADPRNVIVVARDRGVIIGAATAMPLTAQGEEVRAPLEAAGFAAEQVYYFGESVLAPSHRGRGLGHAFFAWREAGADEGGFPIRCFCAVVRPADHPARPAAYQPHDAFWTKRGYQRRADLVGHMRWRDRGDALPTTKPMVFWLREVPT